MTAKAPHTTAHRGKRIRVVLRSGETFVAKFVERTGKYIIFEDRKIRGRDIRSFSILKAT